MFVKITSDSVDQYPYTVGDLRRDNPNTSFPKTVREATMADYGMYPVGYEAAPDYDPLTHRLQHSSIPSLVDGEWKLTKTVVALTEDQITAATNAKATEVRKQRDTLLADTDWMALSDVTMSSAMTTYRQALRDLSDHTNFPYLAEDDWPTKP
tara:strand:- start:9481 stop:9939 length:459 start_codon:yes stop_codon:yes gene_type:complete